MNALSLTVWNKTPLIADRPYRLANVGRGGDVDSYAKKRVARKLLHWVKHWLIKGTTGRRIIPSGWVF